MRLRILGCSGGIGGANRTTCFLLGDNVLIDAGTGLGELSYDELLRIEHVFVTHAHLDHIACLPMLLDTVVGARTQPVVVHATAETLHILRTHIFNWQVWPDFSVIPGPDHAILKFETMPLGDTRQVGDAHITALPALHTIPAVGYLLAGPDGALAFSGDSADCPAFWHALNGVDKLKYVILETAFSNREHELARVSRHFAPGSMIASLGRYTGDAEILITHLKPQDADLTMQEIMRDGALYPFSRLQQGQVLEF
ncbi:3',5'-cyclic-nucleotide phosphodiesterase [Andreprevotia lacus DSM 23236]|jgi:3',5'-cyclic-nucleotide phosphodiesterase|uniref:3',5'-cyclic-nucleotide phosphodiesterase n=1 Tax=Andreprevotia lacus DSM 23236 TaxID=1121001 RepID=A0A1W1X271_9NEIS|nr:3',5'-cyclic-nucleotide phosphodiesterase [Andreprevotia lacus]SMC18056.1 3',5'-cyclic-nucleotide phosphodiesterase [Andreprevotia lacus DSM 23236]